ncbi:MAG: prenyltransferase [Chloroflexi bacterium]|nr:prenyltransferase [Chloroflexota bacterium]
MAFIRLSRVKFLGGAALLYVLGTTIAWWEGWATTDLGPFLLGLVVMWGVQLMTHYLNEYFDFETDRITQNRTPFSGGSGVLPQGLLGRRVALLAASLSILGGVTAVLGLVIVGRAGISAVALFAVAALIGWGYSCPPLRLSARGWGELATTLTVSFLVPIWGYHLQSGAVSPILILAALPLAALQMAMLLRIHMPDYEPDRATGKQTLVVRLGIQGAGRLHNFFLILAYLLALLAYFFGLPAMVVILFYLTFPLAAYNWVKIHPPFQEKDLYRLPFWGVALFASAAASELLGFILDKAT